MLRIHSDFKTFKNKRFIWGLVQLHDRPDEICFGFTDAATATGTSADWSRHAAAKGGRNGFRVERQIRNLEKEPM